MRKLLYIAAVVAAALVFAAPATATEAVSVVTEPGSNACTASTCNTGMSNSGLIELRGHFFGFESHSWDCTMTFSLSIGAGGAGAITSFAFGPGDAGCSEIVACATPWTFDTEEVDTNVSEMDVAVCLDGTALGECEGVVSMTLTETTNHRYSPSVNDGAFAGESFGSCELTGTWVQSGTINGFEIVH